MKEVNHHQSVMKDVDNSHGLAVPFGSNEIRLDSFQWIVAAVVSVLVLSLAPPLWKNFEPFQPGPDYRVPHDLSNDYWLYQRLAEHVLGEDRILILGDSVVWGEYVTPDQTLSHYLNEAMQTPEFVNGGLSGGHPLAMEGLLRSPLKGLRDRAVLLHCNLLWMSSPERDLQVDLKANFNHARLIPQLARRIPAYHATASRRLGRIIDRALPFRGWAHHLRVAYFEGLDIQTWSLEHPHDNPLAKIEMKHQLPGTKPRHGEIPISWQQRGVEKQCLPWVNLGESLQWEAFQRIASMFQTRGARVFVVMDPFNEQMLTEKSLRAYRMMRQQVETWLRDQRVTFINLHLLPTEEYADASHPLAAGYARIARQLNENHDFQQWSAVP
jgi:hypothetical protein